jgi:photosystem II stability/assembly factor-like uncharacterized protein
MRIRIDINHRIISIALLYVFSLCLHADAQKLDLLESSVQSSLRGLSIVDARTLWVSGTQGTVLKSKDGGKSFTRLSVYGYENHDFRDIEAFDANTAIIMAVDTPAILLKTKDGGKTWKVVFEDHRPGMFLDAMEFWNELSGIVIGDPIHQKVFIARTFDGGESWRGLPENQYPETLEGESFFAASGSNITKRNKEEAVFVSGGMISRLFIRDKTVELPFIKGSNTCGANSISVNQKNQMLVVGGDYKDASNRNGTCFIIEEEGKKIHTPKTSPSGYRSCVQFITKKKAITCGLSGVDVTEDGGKNWRHISDEGFHVVRKAKKGKYIYLAGLAGKIARLSW